MMKFKPLVILASLLAVTGCSPKPPEQHRIMDNGTEFGVRIEVLLKSGGTATLVCPKFIGKPRGSHWPACYLEKYGE